MFISRSGTSLDAVYGIDSQGKPDAVAQSSPHGVALTDVQRQMIANSVPRLLRQLSGFDGVGFYHDAGRQICNHS